MFAYSKLSSAVRRDRIIRITPLIFIIIALIACAVVIIARARLIGAAPANSHEPSATQPQPSPNRIEAELITLRPEGFEPAEINRPKGPFLLVFDNRSGLEAVTLRLDRVAGDRLLEVSLSRRKNAWRNLVDLTPGNYVLTEASHSGWTCRFTITAQ